jgi:rhodanese-related sulfurtransferase
MTNTTPINQTEKEEEIPNNLTCEQLWSMEGSGERPTIIDVREEDEWDAGHIEWATHLPLNKIGQEAEAVLPNKNELVIMCCATGNRSQVAADQLKEMGYTNVKNLSGGYTGYCGPKDNPDTDDQEEEEMFSN